MAVIPSWTQFRLIFGIGGSTSNQLLGATTNLFTFFAGPPPRLTQAAGNFVADHHVAGMYTDIIGTALNDGRRLLAGVSNFQLTFDAAETIQAEGPVLSTAGSIWRDVDQMESYPSELHPTTNLVRSGGFTAGFTGIDKPYTGAVMSVSCNSGAADAVFGTSDYHWYLSQRTDDPAKQFISIAQKADAGGSSYSGTVIIDATALAFLELAISGTPKMDQVREIFKMCDLYCKRVSDGAIQWVNLYREMQQP